MSTKYSPRPLVLSCGVCGAGAAQVNHYGSVACYSCRAFFRRCVGEKKMYSSCVRGDDNCAVDRVNRTNCKKCRLAKCFKIGMKGDKVAHRKNKMKKQNKAKSESDSSQLRITIDISPGSSVSEPLVTDPSGPETGGQLDATQENQDAVDICDIAEECVLEEFSATFSALTDDHLNCIIYEMMPSPKLTIEEEYRICEFEAAKEYLLVNIGKSLEQQIPNLREGLSMFFHAITVGIPFDYQKQLRECIRNDLISGGYVKNVLNSVQIFKNVPESTKLETFRFSLGAAEMCIRAFLKINDDKIFLVEQKKAAGLGFTIFDDIFSDGTFDRQAVPCIHGFGPFSLFQSPWAQNQEDEEYFSRVLNSLGQIVRDDVKLGTLYLSLVLATPGTEASEDTRANPGLLSVQQELRLLIYRYLKHKHKHQTTADQLYNQLSSLISDLFTCNNIHVFGRLQETAPNSELLLMDINQ